MIVNTEQMIDYGIQCSMLLHNFLLNVKFIICFSCIKKLKLFQATSYEYVLLYKQWYGTVYKPRRQRRGRGGCQNVHVCLRGGRGESRVCLRRQNTYQFQRILIVKYKFLQGLFIFLQTQSQKIVDEMVQATEWTFFLNARPC